jgi:hypothetical protein
MRTKEAAPEERMVCSPFGLREVFFSFEKK